MVKRVLVCGGRDYDDWTRFAEVMNYIGTAYFDKKNWLGIEMFDVQIISGGADGADVFAARWAGLHLCEHREFVPKWSEYGNRAGYIRNQQMLDEGKPELVIAFPGGKGTAMMVKIARKAGVEVILVDDAREPMELKTERFRREFIQRIGSHFGSMHPVEREKIFFALMKEERDWLKSIDNMDAEYNEIISLQGLMDGKE